MSWTEKITCGRCGRKEWNVSRGDWTCTHCGKAMHMIDVEKTARDRTGMS